MKKLITYAFIACFTFGTGLTAGAKDHHDDHHYNYRTSRDREDYRHDCDNDERYENDSRHQHVDRRAYYYHSREIAYRQYVRRHHQRYRDHDRWYYASRFNNKEHYVYFPHYQTYYDPYQRVYFYRARNRWIRTEAMPRFLVGIDFGNVSVQFFNRLPF